MGHQTLKLRNIDEYKVLERATRQANTLKDIQDTVLYGTLFPEQDYLCAGDGDYSVWVRPRVFKAHSRFATEQSLIKAAREVRVNSFTEDDERSVAHCPSEGITTCPGDEWD